VQKSNFLLSAFIIFLAVFIAVYFRPIMIIDETRYVSVAWEMHNTNSWFVPLINNEPYHHKPPFLFWLINIIWAIFGIDNYTFRFIQSIFAIGVLFFTYKIYLELFNDKKGANYTFLLTAGNIFFLFYNSLLMFDVILTFWVLLGIYAILLLDKNNKKGIIYLSLSVGFGILTKGPVILVHILPLVIFYKFWKSDSSKNFYKLSIISILGGIFIALLWAVPAAIIGGKEYANAIFWGQSANRIVKSFAHRRPFWWYIELLPFLVFPWYFIKEFYHKVKPSKPLKAILIWLFTTFIIFSLISGKQAHYLIPEVPALSILIAYIFSKYNSSKNAIVLSLFYILIAILLYFLYLNQSKIKMPGNIDFTTITISIFIITITAIFLLIKSSFETLLKKVALSSLALFFVVHFTLKDYLKQQDLSNFSKKIAYFQKQNITVANLGKYQDQYHFLGRLKKPILVIKSSKALKELIKKEPNAILIVYKSPKKKYNKQNIILENAYKGKKVILIKAKDYHTL